MINLGARSGQLARLNGVIDCTSNVESTHHNSVARSAAVALSFEHEFQLTGEIPAGCDNPNERGCLVGMRWLNSGSEIRTWEKVQVLRGT
jgi:hypothetical protein